MGGQATGRFAVCSLWGAITLLVDVPLSSSPAKHVILTGLVIPWAGQCAVAATVAQRPAAGGAGIALRNVTHVLLWGANWSSEQCDSQHSHWNFRLMGHLWGGLDQWTRGKHKDSVHPMWKKKQVCQN